MNYNCVTDDKLIEGEYIYIYILKIFDGFD